MSGPIKDFAAFVERLCRKRGWRWEPAIVHDNYILGNVASRGVKTAVDVAEEWEYQPETGFERIAGIRVHLDSCRWEDRSEGAPGCTTRCFTSSRSDLARAQKWTEQQLVPRLPKVRKAGAR